MAVPTPLPCAAIVPLRINDPPNTINAAGIRCGALIPTSPKIPRTIPVSPAVLSIMTSPPSSVLRQATVLAVPLALRSRETSAAAVKA